MCNASLPAHKNEDYYYRLVRDANSIILCMDIKGRITFFNEFAQKFFGYEDREMLGKSVIGTIVPATDSAGKDLAVMIDDIMRNPERHVNNENENMLRSGERVWIAWTNKALPDAEGRTEEILCVGNDISKIKEAEDLLRQMDRKKSDFVSNVAHELKSPLIVIKTNK